MKKLKYVKLFESFYDEQLLKTDKVKFIDSIIDRLGKGEDIPFMISIHETITSGRQDFFLSVSKPGVEKQEVDGAADMIRVSGDSMKFMTQDQFEKLYELLPYKGGNKSNTSRWADNTSSSENIKKGGKEANDRYKDQF